MKTVKRKSNRPRRVRLAKRNPIKLNPLALPNVTRTPGTIIRNLSLKTAVAKPLPHYVVCRSNPFAGHGGSAIPDGKNSNFVVTDTFSVTNFSPTAAGQTIIVQTTNCLPALAMIGSRTNFIVDGTTVTALTSLQPNASTSGTTFYPACVPPPLVGQGGIGTQFSDPYNSTTARAISMGFRLIYTGPATTCAGVVTVTPNPIGFGQTITTVSGGLGIVPVSAAGAAGTSIAASVTGICMDMTINETSLTRASATYRPEQGLYVVAQHKTADFKLQPTYGSALVPLANANTAIGAGNLCSLFRTVGSTTPGVIWFDNDWMTYQIAISGMNADATYRLESVLCMEYSPAITSAFYPLSIKMSPNDVKLIAQAQAIVDKAALGKKD